MHLGICNNTGLVYEGLGTADIPSIPTPCITQAKLITAEADWQDLPRGLAVDALRWIFREDSFDPVTRTRRGRLYEPQPGQGQPNQQRVGPHPYEDPMMRQVGAGGRVAKTLYTFTACHPLLNMANRGEGMMLALGESKAASPWRIIQTESLANGAVIFLQAQQIDGGGWRRCRRTPALSLHACTKRLVLQIIEAGCSLDVSERFRWRVLRPPENLSTAQGPLELPHKLFQVAFDHPIEIHHVAIDVVDNLDLGGLS